jgi:protein ImuB
MFAVLHLADFALHAVLRTEPPAQAARPAALFADTSKKSVVLAMNPGARTAGVELGMTAPQAVARCPALVIRSPQPAAEAEARAALLAVGFTLSPTLEDTAPGICTADLRGTAPDQSLDRLQRAVTELAQLSLPATAGLAATPLLALYAARSLTPPALTSERFAVAEAPPPPVLQITDATDFLAPLPLAAADPSPELAGVLAGWGLKTLGDLTALPRDEIVRRFGSAGLALWLRASGGAPRPLHPVALPQTFAATLEFENEIETLEPLLFILRRFLERLSLELRASQYVAAELALALRLEDDVTYDRSFRLPEPTADVEILFRALHTHLESLTTAAAITAVSLQLTPARPLVRQQGLFDTGLRDPHGFAETLARVSVLVGPECLGTPQLKDTHRPDAVRLVNPSAVVPPPGAPPLHPALGVPLRRFRPPLPARIEFTHGRATYLWTEHLHGEITQQSTEYPGSGDWWQQDRAWTRTEWDIALANGGLYRLLLVGESYFLEGEYD